MSVTEKKQKVHIFSALPVIFWGLAVFCYFFQVPYRYLASYIVPFLALFLICMTLRKRAFIVSYNWIQTYLIYIIYLSIMACLAMLKGFQTANIIRFLLILIVIPLFASINVGEFKFETSIFLLFAVAKCVLLIYLAVSVLRAGSYVELRAWARTNGFGDIYTFRGMPKIQLQGNGILPVAYIVNYYFNKNRQAIKFVFSILLGLGIISAGNAAFILGIALFYVYRLIRFIKNHRISVIIRFLYIILLIIGAIVFVDYAIDIWNVKSGYSNVVRLEQAKALLKNYIVVGNGLGSTIVISGIRNTVGSIYFELQTLYIFNQIGLVGMFLFYMLVLSAVRRRGKEKLILFVIYLVYSFWNPYCFDSTEMMTLCLINSLPLYEKVEAENLADGIGLVTG